MRTIVLLWVILAVINITTAVSAYANNWNIDGKHSNASFAIRHMMVSNVRGSFASGITGKAEYDGKNLKGLTVEAQIDTRTINTNEPMRDEHLKSQEFFDVTKYPTISFKSKRILSDKGDTFKLVGDLTMHGVTKEVELTAENPSPIVKDMHGNERTGTTATTTVNRKDFGIDYNKILDNGGLVVGDTVSITLDVELVKKSPATAKQTAEPAS